jgi:hypothetical protein
MSVKDKLPRVGPAPVPALVPVPVIPSSVGNANPNPNPGSDPGVSSTWPRNLVLLSPYPWIPQQALQPQPNALIINDTVLSLSLSHPPPPAHTHYGSWVACLDLDVSKLADNDTQIFLMFSIICYLCVI